MPLSPGPFGLNPVSYLNGSAWNNQLDQSFNISSGYANNIFRGDPVIINATGRVISLADYALGGFPTGASTYTTMPIFGIFMGCYYENPPGVNPTDPAGPKPYWPAGTVTMGAQPARASVVIDPSVVYEIQADNSGTTGSTDRMQYAPVTIPLSGGVVIGNPTLGTSNVALSASAIVTTPGTPALNLRLLGLAPGYDNVEGATYNIWRVIIQNNYFQARNVS